ncbi:GxxExxY protein [Hymenobacter sp. UYAg731]
MLVELKALSALNETHHAQIINYLETYRLPIGLLINCGGPSL